MSIFTNIISGLDKSVQFLVNVFTKTSQVVVVLQKLGPGTLAAILALFYDVMNFALAQAATIESGNIMGEINNILSPQTKTLLANIVTASKLAQADVVADLEALGIIKPKPTV